MVEGKSANFLGKKRHGLKIRHALRANFSFLFFSTPLYKFLDIPAYFIHLPVLQGTLVM